MRVLVTRAEPNATRTATALRRLGHDPVVLSLSRAVRAPDKASRDLHRTSGPIAVTSAEALRAFAAIERPDASWTERTLYAVGPSTAGAAMDLGFQQVVAGEGNASSLAERIIADISASRHLASRSSLLYLAGNPRTEGFEMALRTAGIPITTCECYRMIALVPEPSAQEETLIAARPDAVLCYSAESVRLLLALPLVCEQEETLAHSLFLCMSDAVAQALPPRFRANARVAPAASEPELLALLPAGHHPLI